MDSITISSDKKQKIEVYPLKCNTPYAFYVRAHNIHGWGPLSDVEMLTSSYDNVNPPAPTGLAVESNQDEDQAEDRAYIQFTWDKVGDFQYYRVEWWKSGVYWHEDVDWPDAGPIIITPVKAKNLPTGKEYHWHVRCFKAGNKKLQSDWAALTPDTITTWSRDAVTITNFGVSSAEGGAKAGSQPKANMTFIWDRVDDFDFKIQWALSAGGPWHAITPVKIDNAGSGATQSYTTGPDFDVSTDYYFQIQGVKGLLHTEFVAATPSPITSWGPTMGAVDGLTRSTGDGSPSEDTPLAIITFGWNTVAGFDYVLEYGPNGSPTVYTPWQKIVNPGTGTYSQIVPNLPCGILYDWRVKNVKGTVESGYTNGTAIETWKPATVDPPASVTLEVLPTDKFKLTLEKPDVAGIKGGNIYINTSNDPATSLCILRNMFRYQNSRNISIGDVSEGVSPITVAYDIPYYFWMTCFNALGTESTKVASDPVSGAISSS